MPTTTFWEHVKTPHVAALPNLRLIASHLIEQGAISSARTKSAYAIHQDTGISYNQMLNLIKKPGFVKVVDSSGTRVGYYYAVAELGSPYPDKFAPGLTIPREVSFFEPEVSHPEVATEVARAATHQPQMDFSTVTIPSRMKKSDLAQAWNSALQSMHSKTRTPEQIAGFAYKLAEAIKNGTITLED